MPDLDAGRLQRYLMTVRENAEDIHSLLIDFELFMEAVTLELARRSTPPV